MSRTLKQVRDLVIEALQTKSTYIGVESRNIQPGVDGEKIKTAPSIRVAVLPDREIKAAGGNIATRLCIVGIAVAAKRSANAADAQIEATEMMERVERALRSELQWIRRTDFAMEYVGTTSDSTISALSFITSYDSSAGDPNG